MSKRLQVLLPDSDYKIVHKISRLLNKSVAEWVRETLKAAMTKDGPQNPEVRIARILRYSKHASPIGDIEKVLAEIERGRSAGGEAK